MRPSGFGRWWRQHFPLAVAPHFGDNAGRFHRLYQARGSIVPDPQFALHRRNGGAATLCHIVHRFVVEDVTFIIGLRGARLELPGGNRRAATLVQ